MTKRSKPNIFDRVLVEVEIQDMVLPSIRRTIDLSRTPYWVKLARERKLTHIFLAMAKDPEGEFPKRLHEFGVMCRIVGVDDVWPYVTIEGEYRAKWEEVESADDNNPNIGILISPPFVDDLTGLFYLKDNRFVLDEAARVNIDLIVAKAILRKVTKLAEILDDDDEFGPGNLSDIRDLIPNLDLRSYENLDRLTWMIMDSLPRISVAALQRGIEDFRLESRLLFCFSMLEYNIYLAENEPQINFMEAMRDAKKTLSGQKDGGSKDGGGESMAVNPALKDHLDRFNKIKDGLNPDVEKAIIEDFKHLESCQPGQAEWNAFINHLDCLLDIYSARVIDQRESIVEAEKILRESHYGMEEMKDRIIDFIATKRRNPKGKGLILCLVGPPGVGKTSVGRSIADALGLGFTRLSLGGIKDEADIRGHRMTYIGAIPGKIIQEIRRKGEKNLVFLLDEIDKIGNDFRGDPSSALLEVLDPEQNHSYQDHYVGCPFDLSNVFFICTANTREGIQPALLDRMDILNIPGYTEYEKVQIAKTYLVPKQLKEVGINDSVVFDWQDDKMLSFIVSGYTREFGVRRTEREIHHYLSRWARKNLPEGVALDKPIEFKVTEESIEELLGKRRYTHERIQPTLAGEAVGLAWTPVGGDILYIQSKVLSFKGKELSITGLVGKSMEESCKVALSNVRGMLEHEGCNDLDGKSIHVHIPEGAIPKDGPSAGITITCSIYSAVKKIPLREGIAMTGEITLSGKVLAIGGVKEKVLAAHRDGAKEIILPLSNKRNYEEDVRQEIKDSVKFHFVQHISDVFDIVFPSRKNVSMPDGSAIGC